MVNLFYDSYRILMRVYGDKSFIKQAINDEIIEPLNKNAVIKICYGVVDNDILLEYYIKRLCDKRPKLPVRVLLKIALYCIDSLNKAPYAVTDACVELCKKLGKGGMSGFLNAVLRRFVKMGQIALPDEEVERLSIKYSYPKFAVKMIIRDYGINRTERILSYGEVFTFLRFPGEVDGEQYLSSLSSNFERTQFKNVFKLKNFNRERGYDSGVYTFQSIGSVAICNVVDGGDRLLDCCAAPGGKSVFLSERFNSVIACELHAHRARLIESYASRMNRHNVQAVTMDSTLYNSEFDQSFDAVLCDVPCSGYGVVKENPDIKLNREELDISQLTKIQLAILSNCSRYVKNGGFLYYSTCSIFKCENDEVISKFLSVNNNFEVVAAYSPLAHEKTEYGIQFLPDISEGAGFYVCKLRRL